MAGSLRGVEGGTVSTYKLAEQAVNTIINAAPVNKKVKDLLHRITHIFKKIVDTAKKLGVDFSNIFRKVTLLSGVREVLGNVSTMAKWCRKISPALFQTVEIAKQAQKVWKQSRFNERITGGSELLPEDASIRKACGNILKEGAKQLEAYSGFDVEGLRRQATSIMQQLMSENPESKIRGMKEGKKLIENINEHVNAKVDSGLWSLIKAVGNLMVPMLAVVAPTLVPFANGLLNHLE